MNFCRFLIRLATLLLVLNLHGCGGAGSEQEKPTSEETTSKETTPEETATAAIVPESATAASRFLAQATFGPNQSEIDQLMTSSFNTWLDQQFLVPASSHYDLTLKIATYLNRRGFPTENSDKVNPENRWELQRDQESAWWHLALFAPDQLRQRVAFALSELLVISTFEDPLDNHGEAVAAYYDLLVQHAFGNYRDLLEAVSKSPAMGVYLSHQGNQKGDESTGRTPDENYAREVMQLFSLGLYELNLNGTPKLDIKQLPIPSYSQQDVGELARVLTGWTRELIYTDGRFTSPRNSAGGYNKPMECINSYHDSGSKLLLGSSIPSGLLCEEDLQAALDILFSHPNLGPYISKHLIMRLVTSNPSAAYIERVARVFNNDGSGIKGNLKEVIKAILLDDEARNSQAAAQSTFGMIKNPVIATTNLLRPFNPIQPDGWAKIHDEIMTPMRSPSVFNFYSPDHQPIDNNFKNNNLVSPESALYTDLQMTNHYNHLFQFIQYREVREMVINDTENKEPSEGLFDPSRYSGENGRNEVHIDLVNQLNLLKYSLSNTTDNTLANFDNIDDDTAKRAALKAVLDNLNLLLTQNRLTDANLTLILDHLMTQYLWERNKEKRAVYLIQEAMTLIMPLPAFSVQK